MNTEERLLSVALALIDGTSQLSSAEMNLAAQTHSVDRGVISHARAQIIAGQDPLGIEFCSIRSPEYRRLQGATYTPAPIVNAMVAWAQSEISKPARIVDPGAGSGRFVIAAARRFPDAELIAVDVDPLATLMLRANAAVLGFADRLAVHLLDYRLLTLSPIDRPTLFIGNPPYVRHHNIGEQWKTWFAATARHLGYSASKLAGLHIHFFLKTRELARPGDYGSFITAAEWLDVNYGSVLRRMLTDGLGGAAIDIIEPKAQPFSDALTTGAITCFRVGSRPAGMIMRSVHSLDDLAPLGRGRSIRIKDLADTRKWSTLTRKATEAPAGFIELGELFHVHRGQVTGANKIWIDNEAARYLPKKFKPLTVTGARELFLAGDALTSASGLRRVIDLPVDLDGLDDEIRWRVKQFLTWAKSQGAHESYIARHRRAWWAVGLRAPAPILCTYMARRSPAFVRNEVHARHINIAHGLYPREPLSETAVTAVLTYLRNNLSATAGRTYAGGLIKFEPRELERIRLPRIEEMHGYLAKNQTAAQTLDSCRAGKGCSRGQEKLS